MVAKILEDANVLTWVFIVISFCNLLVVASSVTIYWRQARANAKREKRSVLAHWVQKIIVEANIDNLKSFVDQVNVNLEGSLGNDGEEVKQEEFELFSETSLEVREKCYDEIFRLNEKLKYHLLHPLIVIEETVSQEIGKRMDRFDDEIANIIFKDGNSPINIGQVDSCTSSYIIDLYREVYRVHREVNSENGWWKRCRKRIGVGRKTS